MRPSIRIVAARSNIPAGVGCVQAGFSIVELMVAVTISLIILSALVGVLFSSSSTSMTRERHSELQTNGRYAIEEIKKDLLHSGYLGISSVFSPDQPIAPGIAVANVCDAALVGQLSRRIWGAEDNNPFAATCIPAAMYARGDVLVIRGLNPAAPAALLPAVVYYHSAYEGGQPFVGTTPPNFVGTAKQPPYLDFRLDETVYFISPYTVSAAESPLVPALYRARLDAGPAMVRELVASGVEHLKVRYGVFQANDTVRYMAADEIAAADWDLVRSVQVLLLMRASSGEVGYRNTTTYAMGENYVVNDNFPRLLMTSVVQLRN